MPKAACEGTRMSILSEFRIPGDENKKLGFGCMRLPLLPGSENEVDLSAFEKMVDAYLEAGFCYFDTAKVYLAENSEKALRDALVARYPRDRYFFTDKLSGSQFATREDIRPLFARQLENTGLSYFDLYLMHSQSASVYERFMSLGAYEEVMALKKEGKLRHFGISFHDTPEVLERILSQHPEIEVVQIQLNYLDYDSPSIRSGEVYGVCEKFHKPVLVMEPVKGGVLASLPAEGERLLEGMPGGPAGTALRYAASFPNVVMVLSGMSTPEQMEDNIRTMSDFTPLEPGDYEILSRCAEIIRKENAVPCTGCRYCVAGCPKKIRIPDLFAVYNTKRRYADWGSDFYYTVHTAAPNGSPEDCIRCRKCEKICPQHLKITELLPTVAEAFTQK